MNQSITINYHELTVKEYKGVRVVTLKDIDQLHERPEGTARKRFNDNRGHFIEGTDFFKISPSEFRTAIGEMDSRQSNDVTLITESGYLMLVKSFTDDLAWEVQRQLVNTYFRAHSMQANLSSLSPQLQLLINMEMEQKRQAEQLATVEQKVDGIRNLVGINPNGWREDCRKQIVRIAQALGGNEYIKNVNTEVYSLVDSRAGVSLETRLTNKRRRMADEGVCKSKRDKLNKVDIIADDKKLIEIYIKVVRELAIKYSAV